MGSQATTERRQLLRHCPGVSGGMAGRGGEVRALRTSCGVLLDGRGGKSLPGLWEAETMPLRNEPYFPA
jgi:hypothetical protein